MVARPGDGEMVEQRFFPTLFYALVAAILFIGLNSAPLSSAGIGSDLTFSAAGISSEPYVAGAVEPRLPAPWPRQDGDRADLDNLRTDEHAAIGPCIVSHSLCDTARPVSISGVVDGAPSTGPPLAI